MSIKQLIYPKRTIIPPPGGGPLIVNENMENGAVAAVYGAVLDDGVGILEFSTLHAREQTHSLRAQVIKNGTTNFRQEYRIKTPIDNQPSTGSPVYWLGFGLYVTPSSGILTQSVAFQWHTATSNSGASPVIGLRMIDNRWQMTSDSLPNELFGPAIVKGVWHDWVFEILWRNTATGYLRIWLNGTLYIQKLNMRTTWGGENNIPWIHVGSYSSSWKQAGNPDPNGTIHETFHDCLRIASNNAGTYGDVAPLGDRLAAF